MSDVARRTLTHWSGPTALAVLLALLSLPLVAISLDAVQAPPGSDYDSRGFFDGCHFPVVALSLIDLGRWTAAAGAVLAAALVAGTIGGLIVRRHAKLGGILTLLLAWEVAIAALPLLPWLFHLDVALGFGGCGKPLEPNDGLRLAGYGLIPFSQLYQPVPFVLLLVGVIVWTTLLRSSGVAEFSGYVPAASPDRYERICRDCGIEGGPNYKGLCYRCGQPYRKLDRGVVAEIPADDRPGR